MKTKLKLLIGITLLITSTCIFGQETNSSRFTCSIKGEVIDRPESNTLLLLKKGEDFRVSGVKIPIVDNKFEYQLTLDNEELYELAFEDELNNGSWMPIYFIAERGEVSLTLFPRDRHRDNVIDGGKLNDEMIRYQQTIDSLFDYSDLNKETNLLDQNKEYFSDKTMLLFDALNVAEKSVRDSLYRVIEKVQQSDDYYSEKGLIVNKKIQKWQKDRTLWELDYIQKNINIVSYGKLIAILERDENNLYSDTCYDMFQKTYKKEFPHHPYTSTVNLKYAVKNQIKVGGKYIDFENPSFDGQKVKLSEYIDGKVALIDLWASWCGPCRRLSISMIPVYEKYKDKGFTVIGVAREANADYGINAAKQDGYPWLNLLELNDKNKVWEKYGVGNAGGATFLVDTDGTILAVSPTATQVEEILKEKLNN